MYTCFLLIKSIHLLYIYSVFVSSEDKGKGIPITGHESPRGCGSKGPHIFAVTTLGRGRVAGSTLGRLYPEKSPVLILQEAEWKPGAVWTRRGEEKSAFLRHPSSTFQFPITNKEIGEFR